MQKTIKSFDGTKINYDIQREKNKKDFLIFVHGVGGDLEAWKEIRAFFHNLKIPTLALDLRGHGKSGKPESLKNYELKNSARDIKEIIEKENLSNPILIGHSLGGMIVITFHRLYPKLSRSYIIISSASQAPRLLKFARKNILFFANFLNKRLDSTLFTRKNKKSREFNWNFGENNPLRIIPSIIDSSLKPLMFTLENINKFDERKTLREIEKPVLIISGKKDFIIDSNNSKKLNKMIKKSKLKIFPKGDHNIILTIPKKIGEEIYSFIKSLELD